MSLPEAVSLTDKQVAGLFGAYTERKRFEAKVMLSVVGELFKSKDNGQASLAALATMGFGIRGA